MKTNRSFLNIKFWLAFILIVGLFVSCITYARSVQATSEHYTDDNFQGDVFEAGNLVKKTDLVRVERYGDKLANFYVLKDQNTGYLSVAVKICTASYSFTAGPIKLYNNDGTPQTLETYQGMRLVGINVDTDEEGIVSTTTYIVANYTTGYMWAIDYIEDYQTNDNNPGFALEPEMILNADGTPALYPDYCG